MRRIGTWMGMVLLAGCAADATGDAPARDGFVRAGDGKYDSSVEAIVLNFEFDGELLTDYAWNADRQIEEQLLFTIGHLNGERSVGRLDTVKISDVRTSVESGHTVVRYHAILPVAWGKKNSIPGTYTLRLPRDVSFNGIETFTEKYMESCVDYGAHDVDSGSIWYYYRPNRAGCTIAASDLTTSVACVSVSTTNTTGKYPEYHKVWEDDVLRVVAVFGKNEDGETANTDPGIAAFNSFVGAVKTRLEADGVRTTPVNVSSTPGVGNPDIVLEADLGDGRSVSIVALLVDNVREAGPTFDARYRTLSSDADLIIYNGHAGLGSNVRALASKGTWVEGQYVVVMMNGCDTHAYVDGALAQAHQAVNPDDESGYRYLDMVTNAMPAFFTSLRRDSMAMVNGLLAYDSPKTYEQIFLDFDPNQVVLVSGEEDNVYVPGYDPDSGAPPADAAWGGLDESGTLALDEQHRYETPNLAPGKYSFHVEGTGDADLYVRIGAPPDYQTFDCRPYRNGSVESCEIELGSDAPIHVMVHGYEGQTSYHLVGARSDR
ncbi:MAG: PPC domain-containing protein [Polyangiales bacterium]